MRRRLVAGLRVALVAWVGLAVAPSPTTAQGSCKRNPAALGVSRVIEIDTTTGPRLGQQQYPDHDLLADGEVVLTFDDGPHRAYTQPILEALEAHCTRATFFLVGRMALADPGLVRSIQARGHTVGTHTWSHARLGQLPGDQARTEIEMGLSAVQKAAGGPIAPFFRFPYLSDPKGMIAYLQERRLGIFSIDVDSYDYRTPSASGVVQNVMSQLQNKRKGIILFHDIQASSAQAMPAMLAALKARGFRVVHFVAKQRAETIASYDARVDPEARRRQAAIAANPLAKRTLTWQSSGPGQGSDARGAPPALPPMGAPPPPPLAQPIPPPVLEPPPVQPRPPRNRDDEDWRRQVFGNN